MEKRKNLRLTLLIFCVLLSLVSMLMGIGYFASSSAFKDKGTVLLS